MLRWTYDGASTISAEREGTLFTIRCISGEDGRSFHAIASVPAPSTVKGARREAGWCARDTQEQAKQWCENYARCQAAGIVSPTGLVASAGGRLPEGQSPTLPGETSGGKR